MHRTPNPKPFISNRTPWLAKASRRRSESLLAIGALAFVACASSQPSREPTARPISEQAAGRGQVTSQSAAHHTEEDMTHGEIIRIPSSMREEHQEIHAALVGATQVPGRVGEAARELARILEPHFTREEQVALPPLGLVRPLANGEFDPSWSGVLPMTDALKRELPQMLREHEEIGSAARRLETVAGEERNLEVQELARKLQAHAKSEEELFYPVAILVGELVRARLGQADPVSQ